MAGTVVIPQFPLLGARIMRVMPLRPLAMASERLVASLGRRHPSLFARLAEHTNKVFLIDPTDLPIVFRLVPDPARPRLDVLRNGGNETWDARIAGPLAGFLGLVHGAFDGDALFFSRDLVIEGNTEAVLALRNAIDNEEIDLAAEVPALFGPLGPLAERPARRLLTIAEGLSGVALTRRQPNPSRMN